MKNLPQVPRLNGFSEAAKNRYVHAVEYLVLRVVSHLAPHAPKASQVELSTILVDNLPVEVLLVWFDLVGTIPGYEDEAVLPGDPKELDAQTHGDVALLTWSILAFLTEHSGGLITEEVHCGVATWLHRNTLGYLQHLNGHLGAELLPKIKSQVVDTSTQKSQRVPLPLIPPPTPEQLRAMRELGRRSAEEMGQRLAPLFDVSEETWRFLHR